MPEALPPLSSPPPIEPHDQAPNMLDVQAEPADDMLEAVSSERMLEPEVRSVWRISATLWWLPVVITALVFDVVAIVRRIELPLLGLDGGDPTWWPPGVLIASALILSILYVVYVPRLRYRFWRWHVSGDALFVERGIVNRVRTLVPLRRVQHLDVSQNLIERRVDLGKLIVHTAGTQNHTVTLPGLRYDEAVALRERLKAYLDTEAL